MVVMFMKGRFSFMDIELFDYDLPEELIAHTPLKKRDTSRLMVLDKETGDVEHKHFYDILDYLKPGDVLVRNNTKVIPARLYGLNCTRNVQALLFFLQNIFSGPDSGHIAHFWADIRDFAAFL